MRSPLLHFGCLTAVVWGLSAVGDQTTAATSQQGKGKKEQVLDPKGEPKGFKAGDSVRYAVWHTKAGWHVRTTTAKKLHQFTGRIFVEGGMFTAVEPHDLEFKGRFGDWWKLGENRKEIVIDFKTDRHIDGINFQVSKETARVLFNLHIDGKHQRDLIYIGRAGLHPTTDPFVFPAFP
jgi:hypothetical protein